MNALLSNSSGRKASSFLGCTDGNVTLIATLGLLALAAITGAAVTMTQLNAVSMELQDRVDGLALSASMAVRDGGGDAEVAQRADQAFAEMQGGMEGTGEARVRVVSASTAEVAATMFREVPVLLGGLVGFETVRVERSARGIAEDADPVCLHILSADLPDAFARRGASTLDARDCIAQINSSSARALDSRGSGEVATLRTRVRGSGSRIHGFSPVPQFGAAAIADPYAAVIEWPSSAPCRTEGFQIRRSALTLAPGVICGDLDLGSGADVVLSPGVHVITGSLKMSAGARLRADRAAVVLVGENSRLEISSQSEARFAAPTQGPWRDIAVAVKPQTSEIASNIQGGAGVDLTGVLYLPTQKVHLTGGGRLAEPTDRLRMVVVNRLELNGNGRVWLNGDGSRTRVQGGVRLLE